MTEKVGVYSECGNLKCVLVCRPGLAHEKLTPTTCHHYLFDDTLWVEEAQVHHDRFVNHLKTHGVEVLELHDLLSETFAHAGQPAVEYVLQYRLRTAFSQSNIAFKKLEKWLRTLAPEKLAGHLIGGVTIDELPEQAMDDLTRAFRPGSFVLDPLPNALFTRDATCWLYGKLLLNQMYKPTRRQEVALYACVYKFHPRFAGKVEFWDNRDLRTRTPSASFEGGDIMPIGKGVVMIGISERTSYDGAKYVADVLLRDPNSEVKMVIGCHLPKARSCMHLDTVFTFINKDLATGFLPIVSKIRCTSFVRDPKSTDAVIIEHDHGKTPFTEVLKSALGVDHDIKIITTGGDVYEQEREQWNDANNVVVIKPGVVVAYAS